MIIGISGKIGSGKDEFAKTIQSINPQWEVKKFAGKLKQIASLLTGVPVEKFEDQEFKTLQMNEEWSYEKPPLEKWQGTETTKMTYRELLQKLGTEAMRNNVHQNVWVNALFADYKKYCVNDLCPYHLGLCDGNNCSAAYPSWIITDVRFPNEADAVKSRGGTLIRINRNVNSGNHPTEVALDDYKDFDYIIENNGTLEEFQEKVKRFYYSQIQQNHDFSYPIV